MTCVEHQTDPLKDPFFEDIPRRLALRLEVLNPSKFQESRLQVEGILLLHKHREAQAIRLATLYKKKSKKGRK